MIFLFSASTSSVRLGDICAPIDGNFYYPAEKPRTAHHTMQMQKAEQRLDLLWPEIDKAVKKTCQRVRYH
jgi:hypothetical protein